MYNITPLPHTEEVRKEDTTNENKTVQNSSYSTPPENMVLLCSHPPTCRKHGIVVFSSPPPSSPHHLQKTWCCCVLIPPRPPKTSAKRIHGRRMGRHASVHCINIVCPYPSIGYPMNWPQSVLCAKSWKEFTLFGTDVICHQWLNL